MTHLPFVVASYALAILVPAVFAASAVARTRAARRRLTSLDPRRGRGRSGSRAP